MQKDIIVDENELSIAANKIQTHANFLGDCIEEYAAILERVATIGIQDDNISPKLLEIANSIKPYKFWINSEARDTQRQTKKAVEDVESADRFIFPSDISIILKALFAQFK